MSSFFAPMIAAVLDESCPCGVLRFGVPSAFAMFMLPPNAAFASARIPSTMSDSAGTTGPVVAHVIDGTLLDEVAMCASEIDQDGIRAVGGVRLYLPGEHARGVRESGDEAARRRDGLDGHRRVHDVLDDRERRELAENVLLQGTPCVVSNQTSPRNARTALATSCATE
ncbi:MAG: hypothetical protein PW999_00820 [Paraburkholderia tropica]|nr:hypothetical protein [Paraburkholderia tropica]